MALTDLEEKRAKLQDIRLKYILRTKRLLEGCGDISGVVFFEEIFTYGCSPAYTSASLAMSSVVTSQLCLQWYQVNKGEFRLEQPNKGGFRVFLNKEPRLRTLGVEIRVTDYQQ